MNDRKPKTTEEVRDEYVGGWDDYNDCPESDEVIDRKVAEFDRWLAEVERAAAEEAWDEAGGWLADSWGYPGIKDDARESNPYRKETP